MGAAVSGGQLPALLTVHLAFAIAPTRRQPLVPREAVSKVSRGVESKSRAVGLAGGGGGGGGGPRSRL